MSSYQSFADYYDSLMAVDYKKYADYLDALLKRYDHDPGLTLDLACGTGSLTIELYKKGYDIYGIDMSPEMLSVAKEKSYDLGADILFLCQKMQSLDLYGTVNTIFCVLDSINHITSQKELQQAFNKAALFMDPGGLFVFDANTVYKHREVLGNNSFIYDKDNVFCAWQNQYNPDDNMVNITLDFFERYEGAYYRSTEHFSERAYTEGELTAMIKQSGLIVLDVFNEMSFDKPTDTSERLVFVAKKP